MALLIPTLGVGWGATGHDGRSQINRRARGRCPGIPATREVAIRPRRLLLFRPPGVRPDIDAPYGPLYWPLCVCAGREPGSRASRTRRNRSCSGTRIVKGPTFTSSSMYCDARSAVTSMGPTAQTTTTASARTARAASQGYLSIK